MSVKSGKVVLEKKKKSPKKEVYGFDMGLVAEAIVGATDDTGEIAFMVRWNNGTSHLVPSRVANLEIPQLVIKYYQDRLVFE